MVAEGPSPKTGRPKAEIDRLAEILDEEDPAARSQAMAVLTGWDRASGPAVLRLLSRPSDAQIFAANVLGQIGDPRAVPSLLGLLDDENANVRFASANALGQIGDTRAVAPLLHMLRTDEWGRFAAVEALHGLIGDPRAIDPLIGLLEEDSWLRFHLIDALGRLGDAGEGRLDCPVPGG